MVPSSDSESYSPPVGTVRHQLVILSVASSAECSNAIEQAGGCLAQAVAGAIG